MSAAASKPFYATALLKGLALALALVTPARAGAETTAPDATAEILGPTFPTGAAPPPADLPAICTDRPTKSNVACTVEQGHVQYESDLFNETALHQNGQTINIDLMANATLKYGLTSSVDVEINLAPYESVSTHDQSGQEIKLAGVSDLYLRLKYNFFNAADGKLSVAVIPYVKAPTAKAGIGDGAVESGVLAPIDYKLTDKITIGSVPEVDVLKDTLVDGRHVNTTQLVNVGYSLPNDVTLYAELWADWDFDPARQTRQYSADGAVAWAPTKYLQLDTGFNIGLNRFTPGIQTYVGISQKF